MRLLPGFVLSKFQNISGKAGQYMELPKSCKIMYCYKYEDCMSLCNELLGTLKRPCVVGLDVEWPFAPKGCSPKVAVLQLCLSMDACFVFHVSQMRFLPDSLKFLLEDEHITKVGINVSQDLKKLGAQFNVSETVHVNLDEMAVTILGECPRGNWGLSSLCLKLFGKQVRKQQYVVRSSWDKFPLTDEQMQYAGLDAYASLILYLRLCKLKQSLQVKL